MDFGYTLRTMRKAAGVSLRRLAREIGVSAAYLSQVERGALPPPTVTRLRDIARALGVPPSYLLGLTDRLNTEVIEFVNRIPEVAGFLRVALERGMGAAEFQRLAEVMDGLSARELVKGLEKIRGEKPSGGARRRRPPGLLEHLDENLVWHRLQVKDKKEALRVMVEGVARTYPRVDANIALGRILRREREASTGIGGGMAVPHANVDGVPGEVVSVATLQKPIEFDSVDHKKVSVIFLLVGRESTRPDRLKLLARIAQLAASESFTRDLLNARSKGEMVELVRRAESRIR